MNGKLYEALNNIQQEYLLMLKSYKTKINDNNFVQIVDEVSVFWNKNKRIVDAFINFVTQPFDTYVFTAVTYMDYDDNEHLPFLCLGKNHIVDDPLCIYLNTVNDSPKTTFTKRLRNEIENTIDDSIKIIENCSPSIYVIPIRYLYTDRSLVKQKADECFLSLFNKDFECLNDYFEFESIEQIDVLLREDIKKSLVFQESEDKNKSLIERFYDYKDNYVNDFVGSNNDAVLFFASIYGNISQSINIIIVTAGLKIIPYLRNKIAVKYFLVISESVKTWCTDIEPVVFNMALSNILYNKFDKTRFDKFSTKQYVDFINNTSFEQSLRKDIASAGIKSLDKNIKAMVDIINNNLNYIYDRID